MRLDKFLSNMGLGTRTEVKKDISRGYVQVNGEVIRKVGHQINENDDKVLYNGEEVGFVKNVYIMLNKPKGVISATVDDKHDTVIGLMEETYGNRKLFTVGRLDIDTEGLLLITDDGEFCHDLMSPKKHVNKTYYAVVDGVVTDDIVNKFEDGIVFHDGTVCKPGILKIINIDGECSEIELTITEGKFHQVKRMFSAVDMEVEYLKRISIANLALDESLDLGEYRELSIEEFKLLKP